MNDVLSRVPSIKRYKASKLESMISFLLGKGFSSHDIAQYPRILEHSGKLIFVICYFTAMNAFRFKFL